MMNKTCKWLTLCSCFLGLVSFVWPTSAFQASSPFSANVIFDTVAKPFRFTFALPQFETIGDAELIPDGTVTALAQDAQGLIWIGTQSGVVRYDGYQFRRFAHIAADPASLGGNYVTALFSGTDGKIWIGSNSDGLSVFDPVKERFEHFKHDDTEPDSLANGKIWSLVGDSFGGIWIATDNGLDYLSYGAKKFKHYRHNPANSNSLIDDNVHSLLIDRGQQLWVGGMNGLQRLTKDGNAFERVLVDSPKEQTSKIDSNKKIDVRALFEAQDGKLWVGTTNHGAGWFESKELQVHWLALTSGSPTIEETRSLSHPWIRDIAQVSGDQIWLATNGGGINIVAANDGKVLQHVRHDPALPTSLALDGVKPLLLDRSGLLWVGTWGGGLQRFNSMNRMVNMVRHGQTLTSGLSHPSVRSVLELATGQILIGTDGNGIDIFDREHGLVGNYRASKTKAGALPDGIVTALAETPDGALWAGMQDAGVMRLEAGSGKWSTVPGLPSKQVSKFFLSRDGNLWVATSLGIARCKLGQIAPIQFDIIPDENGRPMRNLVLTLAEDAQGRIWAGSDDGLWVMEPGGAGFHGIFSEPQRSNSLSSNIVTSLLVDRKARIWLSTDKGLERLLSWDGKVAQFEHISDMLGHTDQVLGGNLLEDELGRIWTESAVIDPSKMQMVPLGKIDGIDVGASWAGAYGKSRDGLLFFGGSQGLAIINPTLYKEWDFPPPLVISELKINGKLTPLGSLAHTGISGSSPSLILEPGQRNFAIEFSSLDFSESKKNRYQYRLQDYDKTWIDADSGHRSAAYGNLWPGQYTLQIRGSNRLGQWSTHELAIPIHVLPLWYQTWWFGLLLIGGVAALVAALVQVRTRYLRQLKIHLETLVAEKTQELKEASLTDPLTNLRNRRFISEVVVPEIRTFMAFKRHALTNSEQRKTDAAKAVFGIYLFDLDHFKAVNDTYGHEAGDKVLRQFSQILKSLVRDDDFVIRWGGEEFLIFLKKISPEYVNIFPEKARRAVEEASFLISEERNLVIKKTVSIGYVTLPFYSQDPDQLTFEQLAMLADLGLYYSKSHGRNQCIQICPTEQQLPTDNREHYLTHLDEAIQAGYVKIGEKE